MKATKFRRRLRIMWDAMARAYRDGVPDFWIVPYPENSPQDDADERKARKEKQEGGEI